jgi:ABC-2 type transport system permease protein
MSVQVGTPTQAASARTTTTARLAAPHLPGGGEFAATARAASLLWLRELTRLRRNPIRLVMATVSPLLFLLVLGTGLDSSDLAAQAEMRDYRSYLFPGVLLMAVQMPAIAVGVSIVLDRKLGVLRQMLVAPVRRWSIVLGLCLGGATVGVIHTLGVVAVAGLAGIPYSPKLLLVLLLTGLVALTFTAAGMVAAVTIRSVETFQIVVGLAMMPALFLSGAMFPPQGLPGWLGIAVKANPLTYAVDMIRRTLPGDGPAPGTIPTLWGWTPPLMAEVGMLSGLVVVFVAVASYRFSRSE